VKRTRNVVGAVVTAVAIVLVVIPATQAQAAGCVSRTEFRKIDRGMTITRVTNIFGTDGSSFGQIQGPNYKYKSQMYDKCQTIPGLATVKYRKPLDGGTWRVTGKSWG